MSDLYYLEGVPNPPRVSEATPYLRGIVSLDPTSLRYTFDLRAYDFEDESAGELKEHIEVLCSEPSYDEGYLDIYLRLYLSDCVDLGTITYTASTRLYKFNPTEMQLARLAKAQRESLGKTRAVTVLVNLSTDDYEQDFICD